MSRMVEAEMWTKWDVWSVLRRMPEDSAGAAWIRSRGDGAALIVVDPEAAADRLADQRQENAREIRDTHLAFRLAHTYDEGARHVVDRLVNDRINRETRRGMIASLQMGYATLRDALAYDQGVSYLLACMVAFRVRERWDSEMVWL